MTEPFRQDFEQRKGKREMTRKVRIASICAAAVILIGLVLPRLVDVNSFRPKLESELGAALGRDVRIGELSLSIFSGTVSADNILIAEDAKFGKEPFLTAKSFSAGVKLKPLIFSRTLNVTGIALEEPQIRLLRGPNGDWNTSTIGNRTAAPGKPADESAGSGGPSSLSVDKVSVTNGRVVIGNEELANKPSVYEKVNIEVTDFSATAQFPFAITAALPGGGDLSLKGTAGPINTADTSSTPVDATVDLHQLDLAASGFVAPSIGIQGILDVNGAVHSANQQTKANGTIKAEKLKLATKGKPMKHSVEMKYEVDYNLTTGAGIVTPGEVAIGKAVMRLTGGYQTARGGSTTLNMKVAGNGMPVDDLEAALPALGVMLPSDSVLQDGVVFVDLMVAGPSDKPVISGPVRLANAKLAGFNLGSKMSAVPALAGRQTGGKDTSIKDLSATVRVSPEGVQANGINVDIPTLGVVTGEGTVSSSGALNFAMNAKLTGGPGIIQKTGMGVQEQGVSFSIEGTASDPRFVPDVKSIAANAITSKVASALPETPLTGKIRGRRK